MRTISAIRKPSSIVPIYPFIFFGFLLLMAVTLGHLIVFSLKDLLYIACVGLAVYLCLFKRWAGLWLLFCTLPFYGFLRYVVELTPLQILAKELMVVLLTSGWFLQEVMMKKKPLVTSSIHLPLRVFLYILFVQLLRAPSPLQGTFGLRYIATYVPIFYLVSNLTLSREQIRKVILALILVTMVTVIYGFFQVSAGLSGLRELGLAKVGSNLSVRGVLRVFSTYAGPEYFGVNLIFQSAIAFSLLFSNLQRRWKIFLLLSGIMMSFLLILTLARVLWVMYLLVLSALGLMAKKPRFVVAVTALLLAMFLITPSYVRERATTSFTTEDESYKARKIVYFQWAFINVLERVPGTGLGTTAAGVVYAERTGHKMEAKGLLGGGATESWHTTLAIEMGLLGWVVYVWLVIQIIRYAYSVFRESKDSFFRWSSLGFTAFTIGLFLASFVCQAPACFPAGDAYFWFFSGLMIRMKELEAKE
ncbi:MAG: hypothetical protein AB1393_04055 [Candidatus Edwardsbacteria bacterium]